MAPNLDNELLLRVQQEAAAKGRQVGFVVRSPGSGGEWGFLGSYKEHPAMSKEAAELFIAKWVADEGLISDKEFTLVPIAAQFVE